MTDSVKIEQFLQKKLSHYLDMLRQMVALNSFTANPMGINALGELTADLFAPLGFTPEMIQSHNPEFGKHLVMTKRGSGTKRIGLVSHLDTVFPPEEEVRNAFRWREDGDKIYGPGTVDIKGGTVMMFMILDALRAFAPALYDEVTWVLLLDAAEESEGQDFGDLCIERLDSPQTLGCLVFEGGARFEETFKVVVARKGMALFHIAVEGKASHAGSAHPQGANAIVQLAETIQCVSNVTDYAHDVTVNVGTVSGGTVTNRVPHHAEAQLEMRTFRPEVFATAVSQILACGGPGSVTTNDGSFTCNVAITQERETMPWPRNAPTDALFAIWEAAGQQLGFNVIMEERGGLSDGNFFWHKFPTVDGLGPAGANAHCSEQDLAAGKEQEYCLVSSFVPKALLNVTAVFNLLEQADN